MTITEKNYLQEEGQIMLKTDNNLEFFVQYDIFKESINASGFIDYDTEPCYNEDITEITIKDCFVSNEDIENLREATKKELIIINEYLTIEHQ